MSVVHTCTTVIHVCTSLCLVGKSVAWRADGRGFESYPRQPIFLNDCFGRVVLCCFAFVLFIIVALPFFQHLLELLFMHIVHVHVNAFLYPFV